jgi:integrase
MVQPPRTVNYKLTPRKIDSLKPKDKPYPVADGGGLFIEVLASGSRTWRYAYLVNGKRGKVTIGSYPAFGLKDARDAHEAMREGIAHGIDPARQKSLDKIEAAATVEKSHTFQEFTELWLREKLTTARSQKQVKGWLTRDVYPAIGSLALGDVHAADIRDLLETMRNTPVKAIQVQSIIERIFAYAGQKLIRLDNPATPMRGLVDKPKTVNYRPLTVPELARLLPAVRSSNAHPGTGLAFFLLTLTAVRKDNAAKARWEHIDLEAGTWTIPGRTVGGNGFMKMESPHTVYLSTQALEVLRQAAELSVRSPWVFPSLASRAKPMGDATLNSFFKRLRQSGDCPLDFVPHGLRSTFSTLANEHGHNPDVIEAALAHKTSSSVRGIYNRAKYADQCREVLQWYADYLEKVTAGAQVIQLRAA